VTIDYLAEELSELLLLCIGGADRKTSLLQSLAQEAADLLAGTTQAAGLCFLGLCTLVCARKHVGEELQGNRKQQLGKGDNDKDGEGNETAEILDSTVQLDRRSDWEQ
jgi:hypothetical protein